MSWQFSVHFSTIWWTQRWALEYLYKHIYENYTKNSFSVKICSIYQNPIYVYYFLEIHDKNLVLYKIWNRQKSLNKWKTVLLPWSNYFYTYKWIIGKSSDVWELFKVFFLSIYNIHTAFLSIYTYIIYIPMFSLISKYEYVHFLHIYHYMHIWSLIISNDGIVKIDTHYYLFIIKIFDVYYV